MNSKNLCFHRHCSTAKYILDLADAFLNKQVFIHLHMLYTKMFLYIFMPVYVRSYSLIEYFSDVIYCLYNHGIKIDITVCKEQMLSRMANPYHF